MHALEKDIELMASNSLQFDKFLDKLHRSIQEDMLTMRMEQAEEDDRRNKMEQLENPQAQPSSPEKNNMRSRKTSKSGSKSPNKSIAQDARYQVNADSLQIVDESKM